MLEKQIISWEAPEFDYVEKEPFWFLLVALVALLIFVFALFQKNFLFAVFVVIAVLVTFVWARREPAHITFALKESGLRIGREEFHPWNDFQYFMVGKPMEEGAERWGELLLRRKGRINPIIKIKAPAEMLGQIHEFLVSYLSEEEYEESMPDAIARILKF